MKNKDKFIQFIDERIDKASSPVSKSAYIIVKDKFTKLFNTLCEDTMRESNESAVFKYADENGMLSSKQDIEEFNKYIQEKYDKSIRNSNISD